MTNTISMYPTMDYHNEERSHGTKGGEATCIQEAQFSFTWGQGGGGIFSDFSVPIVFNMFP